GLCCLQPTFPGLPAYNMQFSLALSGPLDRAALTEALGDILRRHRVLRSVIEVARDRPVLRLLPAAAHALAAVDLGKLSPDPREREYERLCRADVQRPFPLHRHSLLRAT